MNPVQSASEQDRQFIVSSLKESMVNGRIEHSELQQRMTRLLASDDIEQLNALVADLPYRIEVRSSVPVVIAEGYFPARPVRYKQPQYRTGLDDTMESIELVLLSIFVAVVFFGVVGFGIYGMIASMSGS